MMKGDKKDDRSATETRFLIGKTILTNEMTYLIKQYNKEERRQKANDIIVNVQKTS